LTYRLKFRVENIGHTCYGFKTFVIALVTLWAPSVQKCSHYENRKKCFENWGRRWEKNGGLVKI